jgi:hypothetical protein
MVCGDTVAVDTIIKWSWRGPASAQVSNVRIVDVDDTLAEGGEFEMRATV